MRSLGKLFFWRPGENSTLDPKRGTCAPTGSAIEVSPPDPRIEGRTAWEVHDVQCRPAGLEVLLSQLPQPQSVKARSMKAGSRTWRSKGNMSERPEAGLRDAVDLATCNEHDRSIEKPMCHPRCHGTGAAKRGPTSAVLAGSRRPES